MASCRLSFARTQEAIKNEPKKPKLGVDAEVLNTTHFEQGCCCLRPYRKCCVSNHEGTPALGHTTRSGKKRAISHLLAARVEVSATAGGDNKILFPVFGRDQGLVETLGHAGIHHHERGDFRARRFAVVKDDGPGR